MTTVGDVIDRVITGYLEAPDELWVRTTLTSDVTAAATTWPIDLDGLSVEEQDLLGAGVLVEVGSEQALVTDLNGSNLTVRRGIRGTTAATHSSGDEMLVAPVFTRKAVFDAVAEAITGLHPPLFVHTTVREDTDDDGIVVLPDDAVTVVSVRLVDDYDLLSFHDFGDFVDGRTIRVFDVDTESVWITYKSRFAYPDDEDKTLGGLGVKDEWSRLVVIDAVAQLISSSPMSTSQQEFVAGQLRTEGWPVETPARIRDSLIRYREYLMERAVRSLHQQHPPTVVFTP